MTTATTCGTSRDIAVRAAGAKVMVAAGCRQANAAMMSHTPAVVVTDLGCREAPLAQAAQRRRFGDRTAWLN
jgi:hypothetical protein